MADNETDGSNGSFRQTQGGKKRREPPIIDAQAKDVSDAPLEDEPPKTATTDMAAAPEAAPVSSGGEGTEPDEPVLFGRVMRSAAAESPAPESMSEPAPAEPGAGPVAESSAADAAMDAKTASPAPADPLAEDPFGGAAFGTSSYGGSTYGDAPPVSDPVLAAMASSPRRSPAAMILGVVVAILLVVIAGLLFTGSSHGGSDDLHAALDAANARIDALEARPDAGRLGTQVSALDQRTSGFDATLAALKKSTDDLTNRLADVTAQAQANTAKLAVMPQAAAADTTPPGSGAAPATGSGPTDAAATSSPAAPAVDLAPLQDKLADLGQRLDALQTSVAAAPKVDLGPLQDKLVDLTQRLDTLQTSVAGLPKVDLGPLQAQVGDLDHRIDALDHGLAVVTAGVAALPKVDLDPLKAGITALDQRLVPIEAALSAPKDGDRATEARAVGSADVARAAPLAVVAQAVIRGIDDGRPFVAEVDALKALGVDEATLAPLNSVAAKGAPTPAALKTQWAALEPDVLASTKPPAVSLLDRFAAGARQIVTVRRVGAPAGEDSASAAAAVSAALDDGDVAGALSAWAKLPELGRKASQAWADAAHARLDAQAAAQSLASGAIETLAKAKG